MASDGKPEGMTPGSRRAATSRQQPAPAPKRPPGRAARTRGIGDMFAMDSERSSRLLLVGVTLAIIVLALGIIGFGYYDSVIKPRNRTVLQADDISISYTAMKRRMAFEYYANAAFQQQAQVLPEATYLNLVNELTLISRAESELGITATAEERQAAMKRRVGVPETADDAAFAEAYGTALDASGLKDSEYRRLVHAEVLADKIRDKFEAEAPAQIEQAKLDVIQVNDDTAAQAAIARINAGEDWATVARDVSTAPDADATGGVIEFTPKGGFNAAYDDLAFSLAVGEVSAPIDAPGASVFVIRVAERGPQDLTQDQKPTYVNRQYGDWLSATQAKMTIERDWEPDAQRSALIDVLEDAPAIGQNQPGQVPIDQQPPVQQPPIDVPAEQPPADGTDSEAPPPAEAPPADGTDSEAPPPVEAPPADGQ